MITININHAFNGFLYAPLFLASELGFFPNCARLVYRDGDSECLDALCQYSPGPEKNWFAICDPFSVDIATKVPARRDDIAVVGCLVDKVPCWVYNADPAIVRVSKESDLGKYSQAIQRLVCYKPATTGYLLGKRLQKTLQLKDVDLQTTDFGKEFDGNPSPNTAILTSDVLRVVGIGLNSGHIVFNYPQRAPTDLCPFLFTGILTLRDEVVEENLWAVLTLLAGLKHAADLLREKNLRPECISILTKCFSAQLDAMGIDQPSKREGIVKEAIIYAFQTGDLYTESLKPEKTAWDNAQKQWQAVMGRTFAETEERNEPIPALLIKRDWRRDAELRKRINDGFPSVASLITGRFLRWYHILILILCVPFVLLCAAAFASSLVGATRTFAENSPYIIIASGSLLALVVCSLMLWIDLLKGQTTRLSVYLGVVLVGGIGALVGSLALIK